MSEEEVNEAIAILDEAKREADAERQRPDDDPEVYYDRLVGLLEHQLPRTVGWYVGRVLSLVANYGSQQGWYCFEGGRETDILRFVAAVNSGIAAGLHRPGEDTPPAKIIGLSAMPFEMLEDLIGVGLHAQKQLYAEHARRTAQPPTTPNQS